MAPFRTHLTVLAETASKYSSSAAYRTPVIDSDTGSIREWQFISYSQFQSDVELFAKYWFRTLSARDIAQRSVIGLWLGGLTYTDVCHIYGIARAGYIPQLCSLRLPNPDVIFELLQKAKAKALIYEAAFEPDLSNSPVPVHVAVDVYSMDLERAPLPRLPEIKDGCDTVMIFHTSGSTSGCPKLIPCSYSWLDSMVAKSGVVSAPIRPGRQDVNVFMGSMCHIGQTFMYLGGLQHGACMVQPTQIAYSSTELLDMIARCSLNRMNVFPAFFATHIRNSRHDTKLLDRLIALDEILYSGQAMPREDEEWVYKNDMKLINCFGSTECGAMLLSVRGGGRPSPALRPIEGTKYGFFPMPESDDAETCYQDANSKLLELVILSDSPDCPDASLRKADGHYHTGDLFLEVAPGAYVSRGRDDDWIKSENCLRCDTKAIEDNARAMCGDLIHECTVVGNGRPSPVLFVETKSTMAEERLRKEIIRKTRQFHARRYLHERITSPKMVVVVPCGTLPRTATKGNVRRRAVEQQFKDLLDQIFAVPA